MSCDTTYVIGEIVSLYVLYKILDRLVRVPRIGRYADRFVLVIGCGQGFGFEAVKRLDRLGCHVFAGCRRQESVEMLKQAFSDRVHPILMDVSSQDSVRKAFGYVSSQLPPNSGLWGLVNNAGILRVLPMDLITFEIYKEMIATNLYGTIDVTMTFLPLVKKARGRIVNVSSIGGIFTWPIFVSYCISKYGLEAFSDGLRRSLRPFGCKVLIIEPGAANTQMLEEGRILMEFDAFCRQAQSEGRIYCSKGSDAALQRGNHRKNSRRMSCGTACVIGAIVSLYVVYKILDRLVRVPRIGRYGDRFVLVTGCGQGFGLEAVKRLERLGCHVFAGCRRQEGVEKLKQTFSDRVHPILMDVTDRDSVRKAFEYVSSQLPPLTGLWGLVNNAGIGNIIPMYLLTIEIFEETMATNLLGAIDVTMTFLPLVIKARGRVINVSSVLGRFTVPTAVPYGVSKYGLEAFSDGLRRSIRGFGCKVLIIEPGAVYTNMVEIEKNLVDFEARWIRAQSEEGRICSSEDAGEVLKREKEKISRQLSDWRAFGGRINDVMDSYEHALFGVFPRARYVVGIDAKLLPFVQMSAEWFSDWAICFLFPYFVPYEARYLKGT